MAGAAGVGGGKGHACFSCSPCLDAFILYFNTNFNRSIDNYGHFFGVGLSVVVTEPVKVGVEAKYEGNI